MEWNFQAILEFTLSERNRLHLRVTEKGLKNIVHWINIVFDTKPSIFGSQQWLRFKFVFLWHFIKKCLLHLYYIFITAIYLLLYFIFYPKFHILCVTFSIKNSAVVTNGEDFITKSDSYYKMRYLLQNALVEENRKEVFPVNKDWSFFFY